MFFISLFVVFFSVNILKEFVPLRAFASHIFIAFFLFSGDLLQPLLSGKKCWSAIHGMSHRRAVSDYLVSHIFPIVHSLMLPPPPLSLSPSLFSMLPLAHFVIL